MSGECNHDCGSCSQNCSERIEKDKLNEMSHVGKVYAIMSGKGGVGKSLVTSLLAVNAQRQGFKAAILDADLLGPSIPKAFGLSEAAGYENNLIIPVRSRKGIDILSMNSLMDDPEKPVIWRGPMLGGVIKQFWGETLWQEVDYMFVDMPPGTGDVPLTLFQSIPVDGIIIVTSPQELVSMIVAKGVNMAQAMNVPIVGIIENMSYFECPCCGKHYEIFGKSHTEETALKYGIPLLGRIPLNPELAKQCDSGLIELYEGDWLDAASAVLLK